MSVSTKRYSLTPHPLQTILRWVTCSEIAIPQKRLRMICVLESMLNCGLLVYDAFPEPCRELMTFTIWFEVL